MNELHVKAFCADEISWDAREMENRLGCPYDPTSELHARCAAELRREVTYRSAWRETDVRVEGDTVDLGFTVIQSHSLARNLMPCRRAVILGVTLGTQTDRLLRRLSLCSPADAYVTDALASAAAEALCDAAHVLALGDRQYRPRFSPGYGDCSLSVQSAVLSYLNAAVSLGISLTENFFMKPSKSITAVIGVCQ